jgi:rSAM/selenodomain-associated transferase 2
VRPLLSVVVPTLDEEAQVAGAVRSALDGADEVIVVDGGSRDRTMAVAREAGARTFLGPRGRGPQLHAGARRAGGEWLVFLHADTRLQGGWAEEVRSVEGAVGGAFRFAVEAPGLAFRCLETAVALRCRLFGLPYGDQALFVRRQAYDRAGGFPPYPLMEDVSLVRRLSGLGRLVFLSHRAYTSPRRWRRHGILRTTLRNVWLLARFTCGEPPERLARGYER